MKMLEKLFSKSSLDAEIQEILRLEKLQADSQAALEKTKQRLQTNIEEAIGAGKEPGGYKEPVEIIEQSAQIEAINSLIQKSKAAALDFIRAGIPERNKRIEALREEIESLWRRRDRRRIEDIALLARKYPADVVWPSRNQAGSLGIAAVHLEPQEITELIEKIRLDKPEKDRQDTELFGLLDELRDLEILAKSIPLELGLNTLVDKARRRG